MKTTLSTSRGIFYFIRWLTGNLTPFGIILIIVIFFSVIGGQKSFSQGVGISEVSITPDASSILELRSTLRGFLAPRLTTVQRDAILSPVQGLLIYNTTTNQFNYYNGGWIAILNTGTGVTIGTTNILLGGTSSTLTGLTSVTSTSFTGELTGNASTATNLATARAINGVNFDGSTAITVPVNSIDDAATAVSVYPLWTTAAGNLAAKLTTAKLKFVPSTGILTATGFAGSGAGLTSIPNGALTSSSLTVGTTAISLGGSSTTLAGLTSVASTSFTGALTGNASTATTLATTRAINGVNFDGSAAITVPVNSTDDAATAVSVYPLWTTAAGNLAAKLTTAKLKFVPSTGILTATGFAGSGAGLTSIPNGALTSSSLTVGTTAISLGGSSTTLAGLTSVASTSFTGALTGNASTATTLATTRAINGVNFDGSAAITVPVNSTDDAATAVSVYPLWTTAAGNLSAKLTTAKLSFVPSTGILTATGFVGSGAGLTGIPNGSLSNNSLTIGSTTIALGATSLTLAGLTSVAATTFTGALTGNASTATTLATTRAINGVNFDGSTAITVPVNSIDDAATAVSVYPLWTTAAGNLAAKLTTAKLKFVPSTGILTATGFAGSGAGLTSIPNGALTSSSLTVGTTAISLGGSSTTLAGLTSVASTSFTGALTGNASTATTLATTRAINGVNFDGSAAITVPVNSTDDAATAVSVYPLWTTAAGNLAAKLTTAKLKFVPSTGILTATGFAGSGAGLTSIPNGALTSSSLTVGTTAISLGGSSTTLAGLTSVASTSFTGALTGNASTATTLATTRAINGVNFDGSAAITVPVNSIDDLVTAVSVYPLWTTAAGNTAAKLSTSKLSFVPSTGILTATAFVGNLTGNVTGNASTATSATSATTAGSSISFTGALVGDVTGTQGATIVSLVAASTAANVHAAELLANASTNANTASTIVKRDASGNFTAGTITAVLSGNASTATTASNLSGGSIGLIPYQSAANTTALLPAGTAGQYLKSNGAAAPSWSVPAGGGDMLLAAVQTVTGAKTFSTTLTALSDVTIDATGSIATAPRTVGIIPMPSGTYARYAFGDDHNVLQNGYGQRMQLTAYWGIEIAGHTEYGFARPFVTGTGTDASLSVIGSIAAAPVLTITGALSQTGNLQEWRNSVGTILASVNASGNITTDHLIGLAGTPAIAWGPGAGTVPTATSIAGKDLGGSISFTTGGTAPTTNAVIATITFNTAYANAPSAIILSAGSSQAGTDINKVYISSITTNSFVIKSTLVAALVNASSYKFYFVIIE